MPTSSKVVYYCEEFRVEPAPLATPAILSFLTVLNQVAEDNPYPTSMSPSTRYPITSSLEWECEWNRCINISERENVFSSSFRPGRYWQRFYVFSKIDNCHSIDGVWEGFFTVSHSSYCSIRLIISKFIDFRAYAALLVGASPDILEGCKVVCHRQTWKLREHHLLNNDASSSDSSAEMDREAVLSCPLSAGDPLHSYFPAGSLVKEDSDGIRVQEPGKLGVLYYRRAPFLRSEARPAKVKDIIITGEVCATQLHLNKLMPVQGHSAWGQFSLMGRVRPCDGFISVSKEYVSSRRRSQSFAHSSAGRRRSRQVALQRLLGWQREW